MPAKIAGATIALALLGCNLLEASLRDLLDPKTCGQR
jgi:ABC-type dipeptide/oligopeptide/nickel transport system permease subunit